VVPHAPRRSWLPGAVAFLALAFLLPLLGATPPSAIATGGPVPFGAASHSPFDAVPLTGGGASWPTYMENGARTGANLAEKILAPSNVSGLRELWSVPSNGSDFSAPIVVGGTVYYGSWNGDEYAVNATTGSVLWSTYLGVDAACGGGYTPMGISSTPAYDNGTLYLGGGNGTWYALNATSGAVEWSFLPGSTVNGYYAWASALVYRGALYIGTASCFDSPLVPAGLLEVSLTSPHAVLHAFNTTPTNLTGESIWSTPAVDASSNTIWLSTGNENPPGYPPYANAIVGLNATTLQPLGSWQVPNVAGQDSDFGSTPVLYTTAHGVPLVVASNKNGVAYALNRSNVSVNGTWFPAWNLSTGGGFSGGAFEGSSLYLAGGGTVYAVNPANGSVLWTAGMDGGGTIYGSLTWANGLVYAGGGSEVEAIDAANGTVLWNATLPGGLSTVTEPVVVDGELFVASGDYGSNGEMTAYGLPNGTLHAVSFSATGLLPGHSWTLSLGGITRSANTSTISLEEMNGSYGYLVRGPQGFEVTGLAPSGTLTVAGANVTKAFDLVRGRTVALTLHESGLPRGAAWCASLAGWSSCFTRAGFVVQNLTPSAYPYALTHVSGYNSTALLRGAATNLTGGVNLSARGATLSERFAQEMYRLTFSEQGLASGVHWAVKITGAFHGRTVSFLKGGHATTLLFDAPNGTFSYTVRPVLGYVVPAPGTATISGAPVTVDLTFTRSA
jgi:outer membrane protein assembly factor BamB